MISAAVRDAPAVSPRETPAEARRASQSATPWLAAVLVLAAMLRLVYLVALWRNPLFLLNGIRGLDMATYYSMAQAFADGRLPDPGVPFFQAPLYPLFLAAVMRLFSTSSLAALTLANALLGVIACALLYELGRRLVSPRVGLLAAALYAAYPLAWYYAGLLLTENLLVVLLLALALVATAALESASMRLWLLVGLLSGLATLGRANAAVILPALGVAALVVRVLEDQRLFGAAPSPSPRGLAMLPLRLAMALRALARPLAGAVALFALAVLPASVYNSLAAGSPQFVSGQGSHLWLSGNTAYASGVYQLPCGPALLPTSIDFWGLQGRKLLLFFSNEEFGNNTYLGVFRAYLPDNLPPFGFGALAALGLFGLLAALVITRDIASERRAGSSLELVERRRWLGLALVLGLYVATIVAFAIVGRYRLPAAALLCVPAAYAITRLPRLLRRAPGRTGVAAAAVFVFCLAGNLDLPFDVSIPFAHANAAMVFAEAGDAQTAAREQALAHTTRLEVEARDPHGCSQLPPF